MDTQMDVLCDTILHVSEVVGNLEQVKAEITQREVMHDASKFQEPEFSAFVSTRPRFKKVNYGTPEYQELVDEIKPAIDHHYANNRHHTAFHKNGINDMNLVDIIEMLADWKAAERRSPDKKLEDTLDFAFKKYGIEEQLGTIILNTLTYFHWI